MTTNVSLDAMDGAPVSPASYDIVNRPIVRLLPLEMPAF